MAGYLDFEVDSQKNDITAQNGILSFTGGASEVLQRIRTRIRILKGEWFLNTEAGIPYFTEILGKKDTDYLTLLLRQIITATDGVESISSLSKITNYAQRITTFNIKVVIQGRIYELNENVEV